MLLFPLRRILFSFGLLAVLIAGGCSSIGNEGIFNRDQQTSDGSGGANSAGYRTATPPTNPDLRGAQFKVALFVVESGPYAGLANSVQAAVADGVQTNNSRGGVYGAALDLEVVALADNSEVSLEIMLEKLEELNPVVVLMAAPVDDAMYYEINHQEVPFFYFGLGGVNFSPPVNQPDMLFWLIPPPEEQMSFFLTSLWEHWDEMRPLGAYNELAVGYMFEEGRLHDSSIEAMITRLNLENFENRVRGTVSPEPNASVANFLLDAIQNGVTVLYSNTSPTGSAVLLNDLGSLAIGNSFVTGGVIWSVSGELEEVLLSQENLEGYVLPLPSAWWSEAENPAIQAAERIFADGGHLEEQQDLAYLIGLGSVDLVGEVLNRTITDQEGGAIKADDLYSELIRLEGYEVMGGLFQVDYSNGKRAPRQMQLWQLNNGEWTPVGERNPVP